MDASLISLLLQQEPRGIVSKGEVKLEHRHMRK